MTKQALGVNTKDAKPKIGILAPSANLATSLAQELGISCHLALSPNCLRKVRGVPLSALIVEDSMWPLSLTAVHDLLPALEKMGGYIFHARRIDPNPKKPT